MRVNITTDDGVLLEQVKCDDEDLITGSLLGASEAFLDNVAQSLRHEINVLRKQRAAEQKPQPE